MEKENKLLGLVDKLRRTGFIHIFSSSVVNKIISLASGIILVRILSKTEFGTYSYANTIMGFFLIFTGLGVNSCMLQMCCEVEDREKRLNIYNYGCHVGLTFNLFLSLLIIAVAAFIPLPIKGANLCLAFMSFLPFFQLYPQFQCTLLRAERRNRAFSYSNSFQAIVTFALACICSFFLRTKGLILSYYISTIVTILFTYFVLRVPLPSKFTKLESTVKKSFYSISTISMLNNGIAQLMYLLDVFVLGIVVGNSDMIASYKVSTTIPSALLFIPSSIVVYIYPFFVEHRNDSAWLLKNFGRITVLIGLFNFAISAFLFIFAPFILTIIFGQQYIDAVVPFRILCVSFFFSGTFRIIPGNLLITQRKLKFNLFESIFSSGLNTFLNFFLIKAWSSIGAAVATLVTMFISGLISTLYLLHVFKNAERNELN